MKTNGKKSDFELIMEAIDALPYGSNTHKKEPVDLDKIRVVGDRGAFLKAINKENYKIKCALTDFIEDLTEEIPYHVSVARAEGKERATVAMKEAVENLSMPLEGISALLFCICGNYVMVKDICSVMSYLYELPKGMRVDWGTVLDEFLPEREIKVILVAAGTYNNKVKKDM